MKLKNINYWTNEKKSLLIVILQMYLVYFFKLVLTIFNDSENVELVALIVIFLEVYSLPISIVIHYGVLFINRKNNNSELSTAFKLFISSTLILFFYL